MKYLKILQFSLLLALNTHAQTSHNLQPLQLGDQVPDITFASIANGPYKSTSISAHHGKLLILGFWSMYCPPCIKNFPSLDSLQQQFQKEISIILVNVDTKNVTEESICNFLGKWEQRQQRKLHLPTIYNDTIARTIFNCIYAPHYAWISPEGRLLALTGTDEINAVQVSKILKNEQPVLPIKNDVDIRKPLFARDNLPTEQVLLHSVIIKGNYNGLGDSRYYFGENGQYYGYNIANQPMLTIIREVARQMDKEITRNRIVVDPGKKADSNELRKFQQQLSSDVYSVGIVVPKNQPEKMLPNLLTAINQYTEYKVCFEKRKVSCYALVMEGRKNRIRTDGSATQSKLYRSTSPYLQNGSIQKLIPLLNQVEDIHLPVINRTGIQFPVDLYFNHPLRENEVIKKELERYGLKLRETKARLKVMVIRKKSINPDR